jgi:adenosylmethionine-8-amino-7-oxononanoate aminotransferase
MTQSLAARSIAAVWHPCTQMKRHEAAPPIAIARAQGPWLHGTDGRRYLDGISSWWVNLFGHSHPYIQAALTDQLAQLDHVMLAGFTHAPVVELSERLAALTGLGHAFYGSDGASATEIALKMSAHYWRNLGRPAKSRFAGLAGGYHGETVGALAVTDIPIFREAYAPLVRLADTVPSPDARSAGPGESAADAARRAAEGLQQWLERHHETTAALIVEPLVQCAAGMAMHDPEYLRLARALCDRYEVHLVVRGFLHSHSYTGNPLACRAALATLELFEQTDAITANRALAHRLDGAFAPLSQHGRVRHARRQGMIWAWDLQTSLPDFSRRYSAAALERGLLLRPIGNTLYAMPPYALDEEAVQHLAASALASLEDTLAQETLP